MELSRSWLGRVVVLSVVLVVVLHVVLGAALAVSCANLQCNDQGVNWYGNPPATAGWQGWLVGPWLRVDAVYYAQIATHGYALPGPAIGPLGVFFPLFPLLTRAFMVLSGGDPVLAGLVLNALLSAAAFTLLYALMRDREGPAAARAGMLLLAASPAAFFMLAPLSEAAFFTFTIATVLAARRGRLALAGLLAVAATLSRDQGILVLIPLGAAAFGVARARRRTGRFPLTWSFATLPLAPLAFAGFEWFLNGEGYTGGSFAAESVYMHTHAAAPWVPVWQSLQLIVSHADAAELLNLLAVIALAACIPFMWRRLHPADTAYAAASLAVILCHVGGFSPLESALRFTVTVYPVWILSGIALRSSRLLWRVSLVLGVLMIAVAVGVSGFHLVQ